MNWRNLFNPSPNKVNVVVSGETLSAYVAVCAAQLHHMNVVWLRNSGSTNEKKTPEGFDSLAPEGVHFLQQILSNDEIERLKIGFFKGVERNAQYEPFDFILGEGIQFEIKKLKQILQNKMGKDIAVIRSSIINIDVNGQEIQLHLQDKTLITCSWLIDAEGENSTISKQQPEKLTENLWISRKLEKAVAKKNSVSFSNNDSGWQWEAYDHDGNLCQTKWSGNTQKKGDLVLFNSYWYKRRSAVEVQEPNHEPRILLTIPSYCRFDPSAGLGATLHIKSALMAVRSIEVSQNPHQGFAAVWQYEQHMQRLFVEIYKPMSLFYSQFGKIVHEYSAQ